MAAKGDDFDSVDDGPDPSRGDSDAPDRPKKRKKKKKPRKSLGEKLVRPIVGVVGAIFGFLVCSGLGYSLVSSFFAGPPLIPEEYWVEQMLGDRFKAALPGTPTTTTQNITAGMSMQMRIVSPDKSTFYAVAYSEGKLPAERAALPVETLLDDSCDGSRETLKLQDPGVRELSRTPVSFEGHPGKELVLKVPAGSGRVVSRIFLVDGQLFILSAGAKGITADNANVKRLFDSLKSVPASDRKPEPKVAAVVPPPRPEPVKPVPPPPPVVDPTLPTFAFKIALPAGQMDAVVVAMGYSPDGKTLALGTSDERTSWYDADAGKLLEARSIGSITGGATAVVSPQADRVAYYRHGGQLYYWERGEKTETVLNPGAASGISQWKAAFAPDGRTLCTTHGDAVARLWDFALGRVRAEVKPFTGQVTSAAYSPDGKLLACADSQVAVWDAKTLQKLGTLDEAALTPCSELRFSPDGSTLAGVRGQTISVWEFDHDLEAETVVASVRVVKSVESVRGLAFTPDGKWFVATTDARRVRVWDAKTLKRRGDLNFNGLGNPSALAFRARDSRLAVACGGAIHFVDLDAQKWE